MEWSRGIVGLCASALLLSVGSCGDGGGGGGTAPRDAGSSGGGSSPEQAGGRSSSGGAPPGAGGAGGLSGGGNANGGGVSSGGRGAGGATSDGGDTSNPDDRYPGGAPYDGGPALPPFAGPGHSKTLDVLLVVDNSRGMADKHAVFRRSVPALIERLTAAALGVEDLHIGVITSSLGGHGSATCESSATPIKGEQEDDHARLLASRPRALAAGLTDAFSSWKAGASTEALVSSVQTAVDVAGEHGCGFEATLEAAYRFLADPAPPEKIVVQPCELGSPALCAGPSGVDPRVMEQRAAFLRPDSVVVVVVLSDENDCSISDSGRDYFAARLDIELNSGTAICRTNPNDPCCYACKYEPPAGCVPDATCLGIHEDTRVNLRCFEQKRRFGFDYLYPTTRYVNAFTKPWLCTTRKDLAIGPEPCPGDAITRNPLFQTDAGYRGPSMVHLLAITGVPGGEVDASGAVDFVKVLGEAGSSGAPPVAPTDALMIEAIAARSGAGAAGEPLAAPTAGFLANSVNGHERDNPGKDDLQYSCIFPLAAARDCNQVDPTDPLKAACACMSVVDPTQGNDPLCQSSQGSYSMMQTHAPAYPAPRVLEVLRGLGERGLAGSICPQNSTDETADDYGYASAFDALARGIESSIE